MNETITLTAYSLIFFLLVLVALAIWEGQR
jgi:hypothetical protein